MSKTAGERSTNSLQVIECPVQAAEHFARRRRDIYATRGEVTGSLARGGNSLEEVDAEICDARGTGDLLRDPADHTRLIPVAGVDDLVSNVDDKSQLDPIADPEDPAMLLDLLESYLERAAEPNSTLVGWINERRQELRDNGGDDDG